MKPLHIALVDDEEIVLELFRINFKKEIRAGEFILDCFDRPQDLFEFLKEPVNRDSVVIILSDINMPEIDGFQVLENVKQNYPQIKVFMESAYDHPDYIERAKSLGADDYLVKPLNYDNVKEKLYKLSKDIKAS